MYVQPEDYSDIAKITALDLSQEGELCAYVVTKPNSERTYSKNIYISSLSGEAQRLTTGDDEDTSPKISPSEKEVAFVRTSNDNDTQLWITSTTGRPQQLTYVSGDVSDPVWSPDGTKIAFIQQVSPYSYQNGSDLYSNTNKSKDSPDPRVINRSVYRKDASYFDNTRSHIYVIDISDFQSNKKDCVTRITEGPFDNHNVRWRDKNTLYYTSKRTGNPDDNLTHDIISFDLINNSEECHVQTIGWNPSFDVSIDGKIVYRYSSDEFPGPSMNKTDLYLYTPESENSTCLTDAFDYRVYRSSSPRWDENVSGVYFLAPNQGSIGVYHATIDGSVSPVYAHSGVEITDFSIQNGFCAIIQSEWDYPSDLFVTELNKNKLVRLTECNEKYLNERLISKPEEIWFESESGHDIQGWILKPPSDLFDENKKYPGIIEIHGGPSIMWGTSGSMWHEFQSMAAQGYAVFWCNPRGSSGYGDLHSVSMANDWGMADHKDIMSGVMKFCEQDYVDEENLFITGGSYGGFQTVWTISQTDKFKAAAAQRGVYDQIAQYGATDTYHSTEYQLGKPWESPEQFLKKSPVMYADQISTPTLIIHSENDFRVPIHNAEILYRILCKNNVETQFIRYPREGHELSRTGEPGHVIDRLNRIIWWFNRYSSRINGSDDDYNDRLLQYQYGYQLSVLYDK